MTQQLGAYRVPLTAVTGTTAGGAASIANPENATLIITRVIVYTTAPSTGAATLDIGVAANGTTSSDTLLDGISVATAAKVADNINDAGTNGKARQTWGASQFVTATASATLAGLVGYLYIEYLRTE